MSLKIISIFLFMFVMPFSLQAQISPSDKVNHSIYLEIGGSGLGYSLNYERRVGENLWGRVGASYFPEIFVEVVSFPLGLSYLVGKNDKHLELGFAISPTYTKTDFFTDESNSKKYGIIAGPIIGYRFQPKSEDVIFKLAFTPLFTTFDEKFLPSGGISFGYSF